MILIPAMAKNRRDQRFNIKVTRPPPAAESGEGSPQVTNRRLAKLDITLEKGIAMLSKEVQDLVDKSRQARDMIKSVDAGMGALRKQNEEMKAKLDAIASQPTPAPSDANQGAPGQVEYRLSQEDLDALREVSQGFDDTIESLKDDIPANVAQPNTEPEMPNEPPKAEEGGAPQEASSDQSSPTPTDEEKQPEAPMGHQADADAASQAKPLDGTGAPTEEQKQDPAA